MVATGNSILMLRSFFWPLMDVPYPEKVLFLGSGQTKPDAEWLKYPSIRINQKALDAYPENKIFAILTQILSFPKVKKHSLFSVGDHPYIFHFLRELPFEKSGKMNEKEADPKIITVGTKEIHKCVYYHELHRKNKKFTTGSLMILFLLYSPIKEFYIAGFDGYKQQKDYFQVDGEKWNGWHHGHVLSDEWDIIERAVNHARAIGKKIVIAKESGMDDAAQY